MNYWVGMEWYELLQKRKSMADRTGYFPKITKNSQLEKQNWPNRKNQFPQNTKKIANPQIDKLPQIIFRATRATGSYQFIDFRAHVHTVGARRFPTKLNVALRETWLQKKSRLFLLFYPLFLQALATM